MYTSQTYDSSASSYQSRFRSFNIPETLNLYCELGVEVVIFDIHFDNETWIGKYLNESEEDLRKLESSLQCFKKIYIPIVSNSELPNFNKSLDKIIFRIHTQSISSRVFEPIKSVNINGTDLYVPYIGISLYMSIKNNDNKKFLNQVYPLWFSYHPNAFPRLTFEDIFNYFENKKILGDEISKQVLLESNNLNYLPKVLLVGFTNDSLDLHSMPYDLGKGYILGKNYGITMFQTAGLYAFASTVQEYLDNGITFNLKEESPQLYLFLDFFIIFIVHEIFCRLKKNNIRLLSLFILILLFLTVSFVGCSIGVQFYSVYHSIRAVLIYIIVSSLIGVERKKLIAINIFTKSSIEESQIYKAPYFTIDLNQQFLSLNSKLDSYSRLIGKIDFLESFIHTICLTTISDYFRRRNIYQIPELSLDIAKMSLGHYAANLEKIINKCDESVSLNLFIPQIYFLYKQSKKQNFKFKDNIKKIVEFRNQWKHEKSASNTVDKIDEVEKEIDSIIDSLSDECEFLHFINFGKPINFLESKDGKLLWRVMDYSEIVPIIKLWETNEILEINKLYAINLNKSIDSKDRILLLEPYLRIENCNYHNKQEFFYYSKTDDKNQKITYSSITRSCGFSN